MDHVAIGNEQLEASTERRRPSRRASLSAAAPSAKYHPEIWLDVLCGNVQFGVVGKWRCGWVVGGFLLFAFVLVLPKHCLLKPLRSCLSGLSGRGGKWIGGAHPLSPFCGASPSPRPVESTPLSPFVGAPRLGLFCPPLWGTLFVGTKMGLRHASRRRGSACFQLFLNSVNSVNYVILVISVTDRTSVVKLLVVL